MTWSFRTIMNNLLAEILHIGIQKTNVIKKHVNHLEQKMQPYIFSYFHCSYLVLRALANKHTFILQGGPLKIDYFFLNFKLYNTDQNHLRKNCSSITQSLDSYYSRNCRAALWLVKRWMIFSIDILDLDFLFEFYFIRKVPYNILPCLKWTSLYH